MHASDYDYLVKFLLERSGLALGREKEYLLEARLIPLARSHGLSNIAELVRELRTRTDGALQTAVVEAMATKETSFFRDNTPFEELRTILVPELIAARRAQRRLRVWCAAASTGQEPVSVAILLRENFPELADWSIEILATDIDGNAVARAEKGFFTNFEAQRGLPRELLAKYFEQVAEGWRVAESLREWLRYRRQNLLDDFAALGTFDLIVCRNVLIYFDNGTKSHVLARLAQGLEPDGFLLLGASETVIGLSTPLERNRRFRSAIYGLKVATRV